MAIVQAAGLSDVGRQRQNNEDAFLIDDQMQLYIVADGMGGHNAGDVASQLTVDVIKRHFNGDDDDGNNVSTVSDETVSKETNRLLSGIQLANHQVYENAKSDEKYSGMGCTVSIAHFKGDILNVANVGDSPIYLLHENTIEPLYTPHTVLAEYPSLAQDGTGANAAKYHSMLTRAIGANETVKPDACEVKCFKEDMLVICSDGLSNKVSEEEICDIAYKNQPDQACRKLVDFANERGGDDNITVVILKVIDTDSGSNSVITRVIQFIKRQIGIDKN